jgi:hypothetical protein
MTHVLPQVYTGVNPAACGYQNVAVSVYVSVPEYDPVSVAALILPIYRTP